MERMGETDPIEGEVPTGFYLSGSCGGHGTQLVRHACKGGPECRGGDLRKENRDDTKRSMKSENCQNRNISRVGSRDLPLNTKLDTESTGGELAECFRDDPEWDKYPDEQDANSGK